MAAQMSGPHGQGAGQGALTGRPQPQLQVQQTAPGGEAEAPQTAAASISPLAPGGEPAAPEPGTSAALWFPDPPAKPARLLPPLALAYIGDAVYEVAVRQHVMARPNLRPHHLHGQSTKYVSAKAQARLLELIEPLLTEEEKDVVRQGRNAKSGTVPKNANVLDYRLATAFESLVGYLYYTGAHDRLRWLIAQGFAYLEDNRDRG
jgi:23S rRNA maturation mini-RNase III